MKILLILYYYHPYVSGLSLLAKQEAEGLAARGHRVTVLCLRHRSNLPTEELINGVRIIRANMLMKLGKGGVSFDFLRKIIRLERENDIVNPHLPMAHFGLLSSWVDQSKLVPQYHCDLNLGAGLVSRIVERFSYWSMARTLACSKRIIVTTHDYFAHSRFAGFSGVAQQIYPPIDQKRFGIVDAASLREKLGIDAGQVLVGFVGRIVAEKGLGYLIRAIPWLEEINKKFLILIAGDYENIAGGSVRSELDDLLRAYPDRVRFTGYLDFPDLVRFYNLIDVLVLPSIDPLEAFGMVQVEAMLCGTPVVASDMPGVREVIRKTGYGRLTKVRDPQDIAAKLIDVLDDPVQIDRSQLTVFGCERSIDGYEKLFLDIVG